MARQRASAPQRVSAQRCVRAGSSFGGPARAAVQLRVLPRRLWGHRAGLDVLARCGAAAAGFPGARADACRCGADSMELGLSFDDAQSDPSMMRMEASAQARACRRRHSVGCFVLVVVTVPGTALTRPDTHYSVCRCATSFASTPRGGTRALARSHARRSRRAAGAVAGRCVSGAKRAVASQQLTPVLFCRSPRSALPGLRRRSTRCATWKSRMTRTTTLAVRAALLATLLRGALVSRVVLPTAIALRVLGLLAAGVIGGAVLFKLGLSAFQ